MKKDKKNLSKKVKIIVILAIVIAIAVAVAAIVMIKNPFKNENEEKITTNMQFKYLGYDEFYENDSQKLTVKEVNKILLSLYLKENNIENLLADVDSEQDPWVSYGINADIMTEYEIDNEITYVRLYRMLYTTLVNFNHSNTYTVNNLNLTEDEYTQTQIQAINMLYDNGLINVEDINKEKMYTNVTKEKFEDILVRYILKYSLIDINGNDIDYEKSLNISTDKDYFFVEQNNSLKELEYKTLESENYISSKECYSNIRNDIEEIKEIIKSFFDVILNIDYENLNEQEILSDLIEINTINSDDLKYYLQYVSENKIKITGNATVVTPIIYYIDGIYYVRTKVELNILNSKTKENILLGNFDGNEVKYNKKETKYIDVPLKKVNYDWKIITYNINNNVIK